MNKLSLSAALSAAVLCQVGFAQERLEEIVVIASRHDTPLREVGASVSVINQAEIQLRGYPTVGELLRTEPGVSVTNNGGPGKATSLRIRGEEGFRTLILIDGVAVSDPTATQIGPQVEHLLTGSDVERIEVLRGPQGFIYGADAGGVVNIVTRSPQQGGSGQVGVERGRFDTTKFNAFAAYGAEQGDLFVSVADLGTDGFNTRVADTSDEADGYDNTTWHSKLGWNLADGLRAQLVVRDIEAQSEYDSCSGSHDCFSRFDQTTARLSLNSDGPMVSQQFALVQTDVERTNFAANVQSFGTEGDLRKVEYLASLALSESLTVIAGGDHKTESADIVESEDLQRDQLGVFGELQVSLAEQWYFTAGARYDDNEDFGEHVSGRVTSAFVQNVGGENHIKLRASAGNGFRAPSLYEISYNRIEGFGAAAAAQLTEENSSGFDLGVEYYRDSGLAAQLTYFEQVVENEIDFDLIDFSGYLQSDGRSHSRGWELAVEAPINRFIRVDGSFTRNHTETTDDLQRTRRPGKQFNLAVYLYPAERLTLLASSRWARDIVNEVFDVGRVPLDDYQVVNVSANYQLADQLDLFARVENARDEDYQELTGYHTAGRAFYFGLRYTFH